MKTEAKTSTNRSREITQNYGGSSDIYGKFTDLIIEKLEQGVIPWKQPWHEMSNARKFMWKCSGLRSWPIAVP